MDEWGVVIVLISIAGLFMTIGKPVINLNTTITKLIEQVNSLMANATETKTTLGQHTTMLANHETRISNLEDK